MTPTKPQSTTEPELKPCRCGRKAMIEKFHDGNDPQPLFVATCEVCPVKTYDQFTAEEAARVWNEFVSSTPASAAPVVDATALCTPVPCGKQPALPSERVGCGQYILSELDLYRCADCSTPFHRDCLRAHFGSHAAPVEKLDTKNG